MLSIERPYAHFTSRLGAALSGSLYIGPANENPRVKQAQIFWDQAGLLPAAQPISIVGGYAMRAGSPSALFTNAAYSIAVYSTKGVLIWYEPDSSKLDSVSALQASFNALSTRIINLTETLVSVRLRLNALEGLAVAVQPAPPPGSAIDFTARVVTAVQQATLASVNASPTSPTAGQAVVMGLVFSGAANSTAQAEIIFAPTAGLGGFTGLKTIALTFNAQGSYTHFETYTATVAGLQSLTASGAGPSRSADITVLAAAPPAGAPPAPPPPPAAPPPAVAQASFSSFSVAPLSVTVGALVTGTVTISGMASGVTSTYAVEYSKPPGVIGPSGVYVRSFTANAEGVARITDSWEVNSVGVKTLEAQVFGLSRFGTFTGVAVSAPPAPPPPPPPPPQATGEFISLKAPQPQYLVGQIVIAKIQLSGYQAFELDNIVFNLSPSAGLSGLSGQQVFTVNANAVGDAAIDINYTATAVGTRVLTVSGKGVTRSFSVEVLSMPPAPPPPPPSPAPGGSPPSVNEA